MVLPQFFFCGARGCVISCMNHLEKRRRIKNIFRHDFTNEKPWRLPEKPFVGHDDHHGFVYDPEDPESVSSSIKSDWY